MQNELMKLVNEICNAESTNCRNLNNSEIAIKIMNHANIPTTANIQEIPLNWNNQVVILFLLPNDYNYYSLFCGIGKDGKFYFELSICGILNGNEFNFYNTEKELDINYFIN